MPKDAVKTALIGAVAGGVVSLMLIAIFMALTSEQKIDPKSNIVEKKETENSVYKDDFITQEDLVIQAVEKAEPAVVSVVITKNVPIIEQYFLDSGPFSFRIPQYRQNGTEEKEVGGGSGFIVSDDGYVVTNKHVVDDTEAEYTIFLNDGSEYQAEVIATDNLNDIGILKIEASDLPFIEFGDSDSLRLGQSVIAIGNPLLEFDNSVSLGVVSGLSRSIVAETMFGKSEQLEGVIQTDAAINPGNSGGPLLNLEGEVIGVNVAVASAENIGFSLPGNLVKNVFESVKEHGKIVRPFLGVRYIPITDRISEMNNLDVDYGVLITRGETIEELAVIPGSPADKAGLMENDIILEIDGLKLDHNVSFARIIAEKSVGEALALKILSKGEEREIEVILEESE